MDLELLGMNGDPPGTEREEGASRTLESQSGIVRKGHKYRAMALGPAKDQGQVTDSDIKLLFQASTGDF